MKTALATFFAALLAGTAAVAAPISAGSTLSLTGNDTFTATSIAFNGVAGNIGASTGDFAIIGTCTGCVTLSDFTAASTNFAPYVATNLGVSSSITLDSVTFDLNPGVPLSDLTIRGNGIATLTGFDPTPGSFIMTTQGIPGTPAEIQFTVSSTTVANPVREPGSLALLGAALIGLGFVVRRNRKFHGAVAYTGVA